VSPTFKAACIQVSASADMAANIETACGYIAEARAAGADFIALPENVSFIGASPTAGRDRAMPEAEHPALAAFQQQAEASGAWILGGSLGIRAGDGRALNRSFLIDPAGNVTARYSKIHMFDVDLPSGETYRESASFVPGERAVTSSTPWGTLGMTVCYDMRFPHLYRDLAQAGAELITVPAAFTRTTGKAHWHVLLRARAIETGAYLFAPAQCGEHAGGRQTYGHSLIIDPWGEVLADAGEAPGFIIADIDMARVAEVRAMVPSLRHDRIYSGPDAKADTSAA